MTKKNIEDLLKERKVNLQKLKESFYSKIAQFTPKDIAEIEEKVKKKNLEIKKQEEKQANLIIKVVNSDESHVDELAVNQDLYLLLRQLAIDEILRPYQQGPYNLQRPVIDVVIEFGNIPISPNSTAAIEQMEEGNSLMGVIARINFQADYCG